MSFNDGDFVRIDYTARRASDNTLAYTTSEKVARAEDRYNGERRYGPQLIVLGQHNAVKGVEEAVKAMNVGESKKVEVQPSEGFGERDESKVNVMHLADFKKRDMYPEPGMQVDIDGSIATVRSVSSGRVVVDMNHPLAGEKLVYDITVVSRLELDQDKVKALAEHYSLKPDFVSVSEGRARLVFGEKVDKNTDYLINKAALAEAVLQYMPKVSKIVFEEEYARKEA
jgi:FKBP-type peptidyl-prolyl cis-trans isomerase 2